MSTGFNGTPMPAFVDGLSPEQRWAVTDYIASLSGGDGPGYTNLIVARYVKEPIDIAKGAASFASAPVAHLPVIGQIMEPGRAFHPPATSLNGWGSRGIVASPVGRFWVITSAIVCPAANTSLAISLGVARAIVQGASLIFSPIATILSGATAKCANPF